MSSSDLIDEPILQYTLISIGSVFTLCCCINIFKKCYKYIQHSNNMNQIINDSSNNQIEIPNFIDEKQDNEYSTKPSHIESFPCPYNHIRDVYINELIQEYISNNKIKLTESEIRMKYNQFQTPEDILEFKKTIKGQ